MSECPQSVVRNIGSHHKPFRVNLISWSLYFSSILSFFVNYLSISPEVISGVFGFLFFLSSRSSLLEKRVLKVGRPKNVIGDEGVNHLISLLSSSSIPSCVFSSFSSSSSSSCSSSSSLSTSDYEEEKEEKMKKKENKKKTNKKTVGRPKRAIRQVKRTSFFVSSSLSSHSSSCFSSSSLTTDPFQADPMQEKTEVSRFSP